MPVQGTAIVDYGGKAQSTPVLFPTTAYALLIPSKYIFREKNMTDVTNIENRQMNNNNKTKATVQEKC